MKKNIFILLLVLLISCAKNESSPKNITTSSHPLIMKSVVRDEEWSSKSKIVIKSKFSIKTDNITNAKVKLDTLIKKFSGKYKSENYDASDYKLMYKLYLEIPSEKFDAFVSEFESGESAIVEKNIDIDDQTVDYIKNESELKVKKEYLIKYNDLLKKTSKISDFLEIEEKIRALNEEIESTESTLNYINYQVKFREISIIIIQDLKPNEVSQNNFFSRFTNAIKSSWVSFLDLLIYISYNLLTIIIIIVIIYIIKKLRKKYNLKLKISKNDNNKD